MKQLLSLILLFVCSISFSQLRYNEGFFSDKYYSGDKLVTKHEFESILRKNDRGYDMYKDGKTWKTAGVIWSVSSGVWLALGLNTKNKEVITEYGTYTENNTKKRNTYYYMAGGSFIMALICDSVGNKNKKAGIQAANEGMGFKISI